VLEVARNMGTSVQIIQEYYDKQATPAVFATRLGGLNSIPLSRHLMPTPFHLEPSRPRCDDASSYTYSVYLTFGRSYQKVGKRIAP
jgi:hypothetical protein